MAINKKGLLLTISGFATALCNYIYIERADARSVPLERDPPDCVLDSRISGEAAVDRNDRSGDEAGGFVAEQPEEGADQILRLAEFVHRRVVQDLMGTRRQAAVGRRQQTTVLIREEETRGDGVDANADGRHVNG